MEEVVRVTENSTPTCTAVEADRRMLVRRDSLSFKVLSVTKGEVRKGVKVVSRGKADDGLTINLIKD